MVLELRSNDLCDLTCDAQTIALVLEAFGHLLHTELYVRFFTVSGKATVNQCPVCQHMATLRAI